MMMFGGGSGSGSDLLLEDERLVSQSALDAAEEQLQSLCALHAGTFVAVERRSRATQEGLRTLLQNIVKAQEQVMLTSQALDPEAAETATSSMEDTSDRGDKTTNRQEGSSSSTSAATTSLAALSEKHRVRRRTLLQHSSLLELLELASLMDACVRSGLYEEALSIAAFANTLERRHGTATISASKVESGVGTSGAVVVARVIQQIRARQVDLRQHLLHQLKAPVTLPMCLEIVTALRRLNSIDLERTTTTTSTSSSAASGSSSSGRNLERVHAAMEFQLQVEFLEARDAWLESFSSSSTAAADSTSSGNRSGAASANLRASFGPMQPTEQLLDAIERYRTRVFEVATEFNAIFRAQTSESNPSMPSSSSSSLTLLSMWLSRRIYSFLTLLESQLATVDDSAALRDALEASIFFATSMGRLGADFTPQLSRIFESRMLALVNKIWNDGAQQLTETLNTCRQAQVNFPLVAAVVSSSTNADGRTSSATAASGDTSDPSSDGIVRNPPRQLLALPPLARFVNAILHGLNELRRCLLPGIFASLDHELIDVLNRTRLELVSHERAVLVPGFRGEATALRETAARYLREWDDVIVPYLQASLYAALGNAERAEEYYQRLQQKPEPQTQEEESYVNEILPDETDKESEAVMGSNDTGSGDHQEAEDDFKESEVVGDGEQ